MLPLYRVLLLGFTMAAAFIPHDGIHANLQSLKAAPPTLPPIVVLPGLPGSNLTYTLDNAHGLSTNCPTNQGNMSLWPLPITWQNFTKIDCYLEALQTVFHPENGSFTSRQGETVVPTEMVLPPNPNAVIKAVSYDWRFPLNNLGAFFPRLQRVIEELYEGNRQRQVVLIGPSWGAEAGLAFLHRMTQEWKDKYIAWFIPQSPLFGGAPLAMLDLSSGLSFPGVPHWLSLLYRSVAHVAAVGMQVLPRAGFSNVTWNASQVIIQTPSKNYTAFDAAQLLTDLGFGDQVQALKAVENGPDLAQFKHPGVDTFVTYGYNVPTPDFFQYAEPFDGHNSTVPKPPIATRNSQETGDGYVPVRSGVRGWYAWHDAMAQDQHRLIYKGYLGQFHANCTDTCSDDWIKLILEDIVPSGAWTNF
eukprot:TRINITY_DN10059_c0_g1_i1.p2 TRINITY_DN10059_c0_g1~~TRINITY_DN10059_c0_g1_i1.p2  ORF type:complete len:416 (+),score=75.46 TRINITY_DN10059_c0_g1_i1:2623-3870(+)